MNGLVESLFRRAGVSVSEIAAFEHRMKSEFGVTEFDLPHRSDAKLRHSYAQLEAIGLGFWSFGTSVKMAFQPSDEAFLGLALQGKGTIASGTEIASADRPTLASPGRPVRLHYGADLEKVVVGFRSEALKRKLAALLGTPVGRDLEFELTKFTSQETMNSLVGLIKMLVHQIDCQHSLTAPPALRELEDAVIVQLLFTSRHKFSDQLQQKPLQTTSNAISRAEQFIEANWNQPITIESLVGITGVSGRTLFRSFIKARGYSPMAFARKIRLEHARQLLSEATPDSTVTAVAFACGFSNLGRFAQDYLTVFGELPSTTLNLSRPPN